MARAWRQGDNLWWLRKQASLLRKCCRQVSRVSWQCHLARLRHRVTRAPARARRARFQLLGCGWRRACDRRAGAAAPGANADHGVPIGAWPTRASYSRRRGSKMRDSSRRDHSDVVVSGKLGRLAGRHVGRRRAAPFCRVFRGFARARTLPVLWSAHVVSALEKVAWVPRGVRSCARRTVAVYRNSFQRSHHLSHVMVGAH